jgi:hypothetical protein
VAIWIAIFVAGLIGASIFQDNDPHTDDAAAWGALIFIAGTIVTVAYLALSPLFNSRGGGGESLSAPRAPGSARRTAVIVGTAVAVAALLAIAGVLTNSSDTKSMRPAAAPAKPTTNIAVRVRAAARASTPQHITSVDCTNAVQGSETLVVWCAVTFDGPACQLWIGVFEDPQPVALGKPIEGRSGVVNESSAFCK